LDRKVSIINVEQGRDPCCARELIALQRMRIKLAASSMALFAERHSAREGAHQLPRQEGSGFLQALRICASKSCTGIFHSGMTSADQEIGSPAVTA
jgi:hypothetical protein